VATSADAAAIGRLLHRFNAEHDEPTPPPERLAERMVELLGSGGTDVLLAGEGPDGIIVLRFQASIWSDGDEAYVAELYVVPERRRKGLGSELMTAALDRCRERGCDYVFLGTDEGDADAHRLYERFGFTNRSGPELMYVYERAL
jgi:GNAT superfamily N-acetyltransferase